MNFQLTLVRHAVTQENKLNILQGQLDTLLDTDGVEQAKLVGTRFASQLFTHIYSSPLSRAKDTATYALSQIRAPQPSLMIDDRLKERGFGSWEGKHKDERRGQAAPDEESWEALEKRVTSFLLDLSVTIATQSCIGAGIIPNVLVVTHGATFHCFQCVMTKLGLQLESIKPICNTAVSTFIVSVSQTGQITTVACNIDRDISHLKDFK